MFETSSNGTDPSLPVVDLQQRREDARRSLLRANTAVALVLLVVLALGVTAVWLGARATRLRDEAQVNQGRAEHAETKARADLWRAYVSEAKATRLGNALERRAAALESIRRAAGIASSQELRNEAVATLALPGFRLESALALDASVIKFAYDTEIRRCALALTNGDVIICAVEDGAELKRFRKEDGGIPLEQSKPAGLEFSADGRRLSVRYLGGAIAIWDVDSGRTIFLHDVDKQRRLTSNAHFTSDGRHIVGPIFGPKEGMAAFELASGKQVAFYPEFNSFRHASVQPGAPAFAANNGTNVVVLNWETGQRIEFPFAGGVRRTAWSPDGVHLAIVGSLLEAHVWNVAERTRRVFTGHKGDVWDVVFDPAGNRVATSSEDGTSRIWDIRNDRLLGVTREGYIARWGANDRIGCARLGVSLDVRRLVASPVYETLAPSERELEARIMDVSADGVWATAIVEKRGLNVWNLNVPGINQWLPLPGALSVCFHPTDAQLFITTTNGPLLFPYSVATNGNNPLLQLGQPTKLQSTRRRRLDRVVVSANGKVRAWVELSGGNIWIEDVEAGKGLVRLRDQRHSSVAMQSSSAHGAGTVNLSPDGRWLANGYGEKGVEVCDTRNGQTVATLLRGHGNVQFSPDGRYLFLGGREFCHLFRVENWQEVWKLPSELSVTFTASGAFSPDGAKLAVAKSAHSAAILETATGRELAELEAPEPAPLGAVRWTADGQRLVFGTREGQLEVWRPAVLERELSLLGLGWNSRGTSLLSEIRNVIPAASTSAAPWIGAGALVTVAFVAFIAMLSLRHHRKLIEDFARTEDLAVQRGRELQGEREVSRLKNNFVSMVSHEFRTPLGIIQSSAQILDRYLDRLPAERRREQLLSITSNVQRMAGLIDEVLLLGKVEAGRMRFTPTPLDLASFCRRLTDEMTSATHRRCPIRLVLEAPEFPPAEADEDLLRHVLGNLISNASKYSPPGSEVDFCVARSNGSAVFAVRDRGVGIPLSDRHKLFVAFQRGSNVAQFHGTGLGLTIVKRCAELHGGEVSFTSEEGRGTTFTVRIPMFGKTLLKPESQPQQKK